MPGLLSGRSQAAGQVHRNVAIVVPRWLSGASQKASTKGCRSRAAWTIPRCVPVPRPRISRISVSPRLARDGAARGCWAGHRKNRPSVESRRQGGLFTGCVISGGDGRRDPAASREIADPGHALRVACLDEVVEDLVGCSFIKNPPVPVLDEVVFQRFEFEALLVGNVGDPDLTEVRQSGFGTYRRKLRAANYNLVVALRARVGKRFNRSA